MRKNPNDIFLNPAAKENSHF